MMMESDHLNNLDPTDLKILLALIRDPRIQVGELGDSLGVARNTAQTRVKRLIRSGVLSHSGREVDLEAVGYDVVAFVTIEVSHRELDGVVAGLRPSRRSSKCTRFRAGAMSGAAWSPLIRTTCRPPCGRCSGSGA